MGKLKKVLFGKKFIIITLAVVLTLGTATGIFLGCSNNNFDTNPDVDSIGKLTSTMLPVPTDGSSPDDHDPKSNIYYAFTALSNEKSFVCTGEGNAVTKVGITVDQKVKTKRVINNGEIYKESLSHSSFKGVGVKIYIKNDNFVLLDAEKVNSVDDVKWKSEAKKVSKDSFINAYGHYSNSITAYVMTDDTILDAEYVGQENGIYSYKYNLDPTGATGKIALEMRTMAGTKGLPIFERVSLTVRMDENWRVVQTVTDCTYKVDMLGGVTCTESVTENFTDYGKNTPVPNEDFFRSYLDKETTDIKPEQATAMDYLTDGFADYITGEPLKIKLGVDADVNGTTLSIDGNAHINVDINDLSNISARIDLASVQVGTLEFSDIFIGYQSQNAYLKYGELKASGSIDEILTVVNRILNLANVQMPDITQAFNELDTSALLGNATLTVENGKATVTLPLTFGDIDLNAELVFTDSDKPEFIGATATVNGITVSLVPDQTVDVTEINDDYHNVTRLFDIIDDNNNVKLNVKVGEYNILVNVDLVKLSADLSFDDITAKFVNNTIYAKYKDLKVKLAIADIDKVLTKLSPILDGKVELPDFDGLFADFDISTLLGDAIDSLTTVETENSLAISTEVSGVELQIVLGISSDGYTLNSINVTVNGALIEVTPTDDTVDAISESDLVNYSNITSLLDIIDDNNHISIIATVSNTKINATVNLVDLTATARVEGAELYVDFKTGDIYARYSGIKAKINFNQIQSVIDTFKPVIEKFAGVGALDNLNFNFDSIELTTVLNKIEITEGSGITTVSTDLNGIAVALNLKAVNGNLTINDIEVNAFGITVSVQPTTTAIDVRFDLTEDYIDLKALADTFGETVCNVITSDKLTINAGGTFKSGNTVIEIKTASVTIDGLTSKLRINANLVLDVYEVTADGTPVADSNGDSVVTTHTVSLIYLDPSLVEEGASNVYFTYDSSLDNTKGANPLTGTFTTTKASETLDILKQIYASMPDLQEALKPFIIPDENGAPVLPDTNIDFTNLINALVFAQSEGSLTADINGSVFMETLPAAMQIQLKIVDGAIALTVPSIEIDAYTLALNLSVAVPDTVSAETFSYTVGENASDFSSINELLKALSKTAESRSFHITGKVNMKALGIPIEDKITLDVKLDIIEGKTYAVVSIARKNVTGVWKDYGGTSTLYYDPINETIYTYIQYISTPITKKTVNIYEKYTVEEYTSDIVNNLLKLIRFEDWIEQKITDALKEESTSTATVENTLLKYAYNGTDTFTINLDLEPLTGDIRKTNLTIGHDADMNITSLTADMGILGIMTLNLGATMQSPFNEYQKTDVILQEQINSGNYN